MTEKMFPRDCTAECPHFHTWDMSVDDWTCVCDRLGVQIDTCDMDYQWMHCPLKESETVQSSNSIQPGGGTQKLLKAEKMTDKEKVIKGLECCSTMSGDACRECPYSSECSDVYGIPHLAADALKVLKAQEAKWVEYPECLKYENDLDDSYIACSSCGSVFSIIENCTEEFDYCPHCGAAMKRDD